MIISHLLILSCLTKRERFEREYVRKYSSLHKASNKS